MDHGEGFEDESEPEGLVTRRRTLAEEDAAEEEADVELEGRVGSWRKREEVGAG